MVVQLALGANVNTVADVLREVASDAFNARSTGGQPPARLDAYLKWGNRSALRLRNQLSSAEIERLVLTPVYYALIGLTGQPTVHVGELVDRELDERVSIMETADRELRAVREHWPRAVFAVADTSVFMHHPDKLEDIDFRPVLDLREEKVHLLVPMAIIDELDRLKRSRGDQSRWRAAYSLAVIERCVPAPGQAGRLREEDFTPLESGGIPRGELTVEVVLDPPGHSRLPIIDDEIIDRSIALQVLADRPVTFVTYDTGQALRARATTLRVRKLDMPNNADA